MVGHLPRLPQLPSISGFGGGSGNPILDLNFLSATETLDPRITFTRASTATRVNSSGLIASVASRAPRFDYDPVTLAPRGLLIEEQRANICTASEELNLWTLSNATVSANSTAAPDGQLTADKLVEDTANATHQAARSSTVVTATVYTASFYVKAAERNAIRLVAASATFGGVSPRADFYLSTLTTTVANGAVASIDPKPVNGFYRCIVTFPATTSGGAAQIMRYQLLDGAGNSTYTGDGSSGLFLWGHQLEAGSFATSYVPTTSASTATRARDDASMTGTNFSSWYNGQEGSFAAEFLPGVTGVSTNIIAQSAVTSNEFLYGGITLVRTHDGTNAINNTLSPGGTVGSPMRFAMRYGAGEMANCGNGQAVASSAYSGYWASTVDVTLGRNAARTTVLNGHLRRIRYWNTRLPDSQLQVLTS